MFTWQKRVTWMYEDFPHNPFKPQSAQILYKDTRVIHLGTFQEKACFKRVYFRCIIFHFQESRSYAFDFLTKKTGFLTKAGHSQERPSLAYLRRGSQMGSPSPPILCASQIVTSGAPRASYSNQPTQGCHLIDDEKNVTLEGLVPPNITRNPDF